MHTESLISDSEAPVAKEPVEFKEKAPKNSLKAPKNAVSDEGLFKDFDEKIATISSSAEKIRECLNVMRLSLHESSKPQFGLFWHARKVCLPLFKDNLESSERAVVWQEFSELTKEARSLKEILQEQSSFAVEQIEFAVVALQDEMQKVEEGKISEWHFNPGCLTLSANAENYQNWQRSLNVYNALAIRVNALRKEILKTEMRLKIKNKLFEKLSSVGDKIFPKRKELIKLISESFQHDVDQFIHAHFEDENFNEPLYFYRDEIKSLQSCAKSLTLNTKSFTSTRVALSKCWDKVKELEGELKLKRNERKVRHEENAKQIQDMLDAFVADQVADENIESRLEEIVLKMRQIELAKEDVKAFKDRIQELKEPLLAKKKAAELALTQKIQEEQKALQQKYLDVKAVIEGLLDSTDLELEVMEQEFNKVVAEIAGLKISKREKATLDQLVRKYKHKMDERKYRQLLMSKSDQKTVEGLYARLEELRELRNTLKIQIDGYRKAQGGSGLDFEKAMYYSELISEGRGRLDELDVAISEIEKNLQAL